MHMMTIAKNSLIKQLTNLWQRAFVSGCAALLVACGGGSSNTSTSDTGGTGGTATSAAYSVQLVSGALGGQGYVDGPASAARFSSNSIVQYEEPDGALIVSDSGNGATRRVSADRSNVTTIMNRSFNSMVLTPNGFVGSSGSRIFNVDLSGAEPVVTVLAGTTTGGTSLDGVGSAARFGIFNVLARGSDGAVYAADVFNVTVRKILPDGTVSTIAGASGVRDFVDGAGVDARFLQVQGIAVDSASNVYISDGTRIRKITPAGSVSTFAGSSVAGIDDGVGAAATFVGNSGLSVTPDGLSLVLASNATVLRRIDIGTAQVSTIYSQSSPAVTATAYDGSLATARLGGTIRALIDSSGKVVFYDFSFQTLRGMNLSAGAATDIYTLVGTRRNAGGVAGSASDARFADITNLTAQNGTAHVISSNGRLSRVDTVGNVTDTLASSNLYYSDAIVADASGQVYVAPYFDGTVQKVAADASTSTWVGTSGVTGIVDGTGADARLEYVTAMALASDGSLYIADAAGKLVRRITPAGVVSTIAGNAAVNFNQTGTGAAASFGNISSMMLASNGDLIINSRSEFFRMTPAGVVTALYTQATSGTAYVGVSSRDLAQDAAGNIYGIAEGSTTRLFRLTPTGSMSIQANLNSATGKAVKLGASGSINRPVGWQFLRESATELEFLTADGYENAVLKITLSKVP